MKRFFLLLLILFFQIMPALSLELDTSVDAEIRKKYDADKLNETVLPALPNVSPSVSKQSKKSVKTVPIESHSLLKLSSSEAASKIPARTKFKVKSNCKIADWLKENSSVSFISTESVIKKHFAVPSGAIFIGKVVKSHSPQISGNGGLVIIKITEMKYGEHYYSVNGKITKAGGKKVFFNKIKGQRQYITGVSKQIDKGEKFYKKSRNLSSKLSNNPIGQILSPVPTIVGSVGYGIVTVVSPVTGISQKGKNCAYSENTSFEIKLLDPVYLK